MTSTLELYGAQTGNSIRAAIALEEAGLPYTPRLVDLASQQHQSADYLTLNPMGKVPVLVETAQDKEPFVLTQSNAIILYAAGKAPGRLLPAAERDRAVAIERLFFFVTDVIAVSHAAFSLRAADADRARDILAKRMLSTLEHAERFVGNDEFIAGAAFSAADIAAFTISKSVEADLPWRKLPKLQRWFAMMEARPAVQRGFAAFASH